MNQNPKLLRSVAAVVGGFALFTGAVSAAPFVYTSGDLVLTFRRTGNASDYVVNLGKVTGYNQLPAGTTLVVTNLSGAQLSSAFAADYNDLKWSVAAASRPDNPVAGYPLQTLWVTRPRSEAVIQSSPWLRKSTASQGNVSSQIGAVGGNAASASSLLGAGANNTVTGVVIPVSHYYNVSTPIGAAGNYAGNFQGNVETVTASDFVDEPANVSRADFYELQPGSGNPPATYLGYFELKPDGSLTFSTPSTLPPAPTITSIVRAGGVTTVSFATQTGFTYRLRSVGAAGLNTPISTWTLGNSIVGTGGVLTLTDTSSDEVRFYALDVQ
ncbi:MAG: hypothetical protein QM813_19490 [Verrucomicrobiota bacterium]